MSVSIDLKKGFRETKEYEVTQEIRKMLASEPKTWNDLCKKLKRLASKAIIYFALRDLIRWNVVYGFIDSETLNKTKSKIVPFYNLTGINPIMHGGGFPDKSSMYAVLELDDKGNEIGRQLYKTIRSRLGSRYEYVDRKVGKSQRIKKDDREFERTKTFGHSKT